MSDKYPGGFVTASAPAGFSVAFDGTGDYLTLASNAAFAFGTGDFTIECWIYLTGANVNYRTIIATRASGTSAAGWTLATDAAGNIYIYSNAFIVQASSAIVPNTWYHVAVCRVSGTTTLYLNGVSKATSATARDYTDSSLAISNDVYNSGEVWQGYISNVRVLKGTALYTTAFTPPTQLFPITNTSLLTCQSPTIIDNSTNNFTITANGNAAPSNFTPFAAYQGFNPALGAAAGGVWTLDEAAYYQNNRQWPIYDPYFNQTTLMLHGNGTNAAQNNTFLDSSTNNFAITRNGNTAQGTFSPFSQTGWSNYFVGGYFSVPDNTNLKPGTGDFTWEAWLYPVADGGNYFLFAQGASGLDIYRNTSNKLVIDHANVANLLTSTNTIPLNTWTHYAFTRSGTVTRLFVNGVLDVSGTNSGNITNASATSIGNNWTGYISNTRFVKGTAVYTSNFTPSTQPLTAVTGTSLLTCQSQRFVDNSALNATITISSAPSVQAFSPFVPAYITPTTYSNWFDGTGDYLTSPTNAAFGYGTSDFTIEFWLNLTTNVTQTIFSNLTSTSSINPHIYLSTTIRYYTNGTDQITGATLNANQWYHIALSKASGSTKLFVNGVQSGSTYTDVNNYGSTAPLGIGTFWDSGAPTATNAIQKGVISNLRIVKGTAVYTANFTPPTAPLTAITNTTLLTCQSSTFVDNSSSALTITATGNVQPVTSPTPFPAKVDTTTLNSAYSTSLIGGSYYGDGTGDYVRTPTDVAFALGTSDFTFETWLYPTVAGNDSVVIDNRNPSGGIQGFAVSWATGSVIRVIVGAPNAWDVDQSTAAVGANSWIHYALTRSGTTFRIFLNGALVYTSGAISGSMGTTAVYATVGAAYNGANPFTGYFSGTRLIKGTCLYTSSFAPPLAPLTPVTNTSVLLNYTNAGIIDNAANNVLETVGNAQISTTQSKWGGSSMYFDGTGDWLVAANGRNFINGTEPFTIECWVYITGTPNYWSICGAGGGTLVLTIQNLTTININPYGSANTLSVTTSLSINTWTHIAATRNSANRFDIWVNGVSAGNTTSSQSFGSPTYYAIGAADSGTTQPFIGYLDDVRITKACRYFGTFTPPTSQLQDQ